MDEQVMDAVRGPVIVRGSASDDDSFLPGVHSHNASRRSSRARRRSGPLYGLRVLLFVIGICALAWYSYSIVSERVYQAYENHLFDQQIARPSQAPMSARPANGAVLGRVEIGRLHVSAIVREGVDAKTLSVAVGHVPSTTLPGQSGNFVIAAHRDTLFRALKDIQTGDVVTFNSESGTFRYRVIGTRIVEPSNVSVLRADGGGLVPAAMDTPRPALLTMITCYPFYYVGSAPERFIVEAQLIGASPAEDAASGHV